MQFSSLLAGVYLFSSLAMALPADAWKRLSIYQVLTDRFALAAGSLPDCSPRSYCGGTWKGIENKLDYIQGMGFDAVWISPVIHNIEGNTTWGEAYHGYWGDNPYTLDEHFGNPQDLKDLSAALHERNMYLMVDVVINHLAANQSPNEIDYSLFPSPFNSSTAFHPDCSMNLSNETSIQNCWLAADTPPLLAHVNSENPLVFDAMVQSVVDLVQNYSIDGIRLDTARHIPKQYLALFEEAVDVFVMGEVVDANASYVSQFQVPLEGVLNYPLFFRVQDAFTGNTTFDMLGAAVEAQQDLYSDPFAVANFLDNHDEPRFASHVGADVVREMNAATFLMFTSGIPVVYYGFEQRFAGLADPDNRLPLWTSDYDVDAPLYSYLALLHRARRHAAEAFDEDAYYDAPVSVLGTCDNYMAIERGPVVVVVSNMAEQTAAEESDLRGYEVQRSRFLAGERIVDLLSCNVITMEEDGAFMSLVVGGMARIWVREDLGLGFC